MIAKIGRGADMYGVLAYNLNKVHEHKAAIIHLKNMIESPDGTYATRKLLLSFIPYLSANRKTEKTVLHISLNPEPNDRVSDEDYKKIADEYMNKMGYGNQPYVVFKHSDIERTHIHIVSTCVNKEGMKISDSFEKRRSMEVCRELEHQFNLSPAMQKQQIEETMRLSPVDYVKGNLKSQMARLIRYLPKSYHFRSLGEYNALLSLVNITSELVRKEINGEIKEGLVYFALDQNGSKVSNPFKASLFGKQASLVTLKRRMEQCSNIPSLMKEKTSRVISETLKITTNEQEFKEKLVSQGIHTVIRRNENGRIYGITFIDHNSKNVLNGSRLGKQFSANSFNGMLTEQKLTESSRSMTANPAPADPVRSHALKEDVHPLFTFTTYQYTGISELGFLNSLLLDSRSEDPEELEFEYEMKKKKKRRSKRN